MLRAACILVLFVSAGAVQAFADDNDVVFRSDVSLVRVDAQVVDRDNRAVTGLRAGRLRAARGGPAAADP